MQVSKNISQSVPVVSGIEPPSSIKLTLCFCFLPSTQSGIADGLTFSLPLVLTAHWLSFLNCSSLASHCLLCLVCFSQTLHLCVSFWFHFFWYFFLKFHKGTRTYAQLPRRPVPPPKPRRSKKGVSRCRLRLSTSLLYSLLCCASLSACFTWAFCSFSCCFSLSDRAGGWGGGGVGVWLL